MILFFLGTEYVIEIKNGSGKTISVMTSVDGNKVTKGPKIISNGGKRIIKGFTVKRETSESLNALGQNISSIEQHEEPFVAIRDKEGETKSNGVDDNIGKITFVFTQVKYINCSAGNKSKHSSKKSNTSHRQGRARAGVLRTVHGENVNIRYHSQVNRGGRRPVTDKKKVIGRMRITICDRDQGKGIFQGLFQGEETSALETKGN